MDPTALKLLNDNHDRFLCPTSTLKQQLSDLEQIHVWCSIANDGQ